MSSWDSRLSYHIPSVSIASHCDGTSHAATVCSTCIGHIALGVGDIAREKWETICLICRSSEWDFKDGPRVSTSSCCPSRALWNNVNWCGSYLLDIIAYRGVGTADQVVFGEHITEWGMKQSSDWHWLQKK